VQDLRTAVLQAHDRLEKLLGARQVSAHFLTNKTKLRVNLEKAESEISRPFCVEAGMSVDLDFQATIEITKDYIVGFELRRDGTPVARTRAGDDEGPSSLSLLYRATMTGASSFQLFFTSVKELTATSGYHGGYGGHGHGYGHGYGHHHNYSSYSTKDSLEIMPKNLQLGLRIYGEDYPMASDMSLGDSVCCPAGSVYVLDDVFVGPTPPATIVTPGTLPPTGINLPAFNAVPSLVDDGIQFGTTDILTRNQFYVQTNAPNALPLPVPPARVGSILNPACLCDSSMGLVPSTDALSATPAAANTIVCIPNPCLNEGRGNGIGPVGFQRTFF